MLVVGTFAELFSNDRPLVARYNGEWFFPIFSNQPEARFGGDFATPTEWDDPFIREQFAKPGNFALYTFNTWGAGALDYYARAADPSPPSRRPLARHRPVGPRHDRAAALRLPRQHLLQPRADLRRDGPAASSSARCRATSAGAST